MQNFSRLINVLANILVVVSIGFTWAYFSSADLRFWIADSFAQRAWYFFGDYCTAKADPAVSANCPEGYEPGRFKLINFYSPRMGSGARIQVKTADPKAYRTEVAQHEGTLIISSANGFVPGRERADKDARLLLVLGKGDCLFVDKINQLDSTSQQNVLNVWVYGFVFDCQNRALR